MPRPCPPRVDDHAAGRDPAARFLTRPHSTAAASRSTPNEALPRVKIVFSRDAFAATVLEAALEEEMTDHLGHPKHQAPEGGAGNIRNGTRGKTVLTDAAGEVQIAVPRDRAGTFEPVIVKKRQRRLSDVDAVVLSLYARGLTTGEISAHFAEIYGASVSKDSRPESVLGQVPAPAPPPGATRRPRPTDPGAAQRPPEAPSVARPRPGGWP